MARKPQCPHLGPQELQGRRLKRQLPCRSMAHFCSLQLELYFVMGF